MTAPTSDERREVAARLRKTRGIMAFVEALGIDPDGDWCWTDVSRRVADLIDPTCEVEAIATMDWPEGTGTTVYEFSCGHSCETTRPVAPDYCPRCGARVVDGGDA